jgi:WD40 repeat protein
MFTVFSLAVSPDGQRLATGSGDGIVSVWDARSGKLIKRLGRPTNPISGLAFSKGAGRFLTAASFDSSVIVFDVESGQMLWRWRAHGRQSIHALALSPDNQRLATGAQDRTVKLWAMNWGAKTNHEVLTFRDFTKEVQCASFSHDGRSLAAGSTDGTIQMWDATPPTDDSRECSLTLNQGVEVRTINLRQDGLWLATGGERLPDEQGGIAPVFIWNSRTGRLLQTISRDSLYLFSTDFSPDGRFLVTTADDRDYRSGYSLQIWDVATGRIHLCTEPFPGEGCVFSATYSLDGRRLLGGAQDGEILVWDAATGHRICQLGKHDGTVFNLLLSPNGHYLASAASTEQVKLWDGTRLDAAQTNFFEIATVVGEISDTLAFSPDSRRLVVATDDQLATVWEIENRTNVLSLRSESVHGFRAVAFSTDGRWIASGGTDCKVKLWDARTGELLHTFRGHKGEVLRVRFFTLPEGPRLISGSRDGTIKYWDLQPFQAADRGATKEGDEHH